MSYVEPADRSWTKSSRCDNGTCVEVAWSGVGVAVRDNTIPDVQLPFDRASWESLLGAVRGDRLGR